MTERLFQYIWHLQHYNNSELRTTDSETLTILHPGNQNTNQGPDFLDARIKVNNTMWVGNIELHIRASHWLNHDHSNDSNYNNVILHVVWIEDIRLNLAFPVLELQNRVSKFLLLKFDELMNSRSFIPCGQMINHATHLMWTNWKDRLMVERMQKKSVRILQYLEENKNHWEETFWWLIARNFGSTVNGDAFEQIARSLPLSILAKHKNQVQQTEALLFGQAGLLEKDFEDGYPSMLRKEYQFYKNKYRLQGIGISVHFLRMRPSNFPTVRLAQLAMLVHKSVHLFSVLKETVSLVDIRDLLCVQANDYWHYHYTFDEPTQFKVKKLGSQMIDSLVINAVLPMLFAYGHRHGEQEFKDRAMNLLAQLNPEKNMITNGYTGLGIENKNAFDSQALLQLKTGYCNEKRCLECAVGNKLLRSVPH